MAGNGLGKIWKVKMPFFIIVTKTKGIFCPTHLPCGSKNVILKIERKMEGDYSAGVFI